MTLQDPYFDDIRQILSAERFESYGRHPNLTDQDRLARYLWNIALCEALYPLLQGLEIGLRNSIHNAFSAYYDTPLWFDQTPPGLGRFELARIVDARKSLDEQRKPHTPGRIVGELRFGFWTGLLDSRYENKIWHTELLETTFPYLEKENRTRNTLSASFTKVRRLRNRIFHHKPIWYWKDLKEQHRQMLEILGWLSPAKRETLKAIDNFPEVYERGTAYYHSKVEELLEQFEL